MWLLLLVALCLSQGLGSAIPTEEEFHNPERFMNISQKIRFQGYPSEEYEVTTEDGYILSLNRIPHGRNAPRTPVLIVHGFCLDGGDWVDNLPDNSLAFILADAGYDVWIGNNRGNSWSRGHLDLSVHEEAFWDFSFHEMAIYDLPAMVGFIIMQTEQERLFYIGHAQGSSLGFIAFSSLPHLGEKIKLFFALAPGYTLSHVRSPVLKALLLPDAVLKLKFGTKELSLVSRKDRASRAEKCIRFPVEEICENEIFLIGGYNRKNLNMTAKSGHFRQFDYGFLKNQEKYNQSTPPFYRIEDMTVPVAVWSGGEDWVNTPKETQQLLRRLTNVIQHKQLHDWNHFDPHWGQDAPQRLYSQILFLMGQHS
ncbi:lipase member M-like [Myiozetetes cayanensis]|uniref:lipase member M-like n=1 Tax=Myiozetetes cayanensis TaxID=478635 RepID=UPI00215FDC46|nr:lipase member M-like [Myiozetetes cayanensis]